MAPKLIIIGQELVGQFIDMPEPMEHVASFVLIPDPEISENHALDHAQAHLENVNASKVALFHEATLDQPKTDLETSKKIYLHDPCFHIFTSGTTGLPKAGILTHGRWMKIYGGIGKLAIRLQKNDTLFATMPLYHATALCVCWSSVIAARASFALNRRFSASGFWDDCIRYHATAIGYVGDLCRFLLNQPPHTAEQQHSVRTMLGNGLRPALWSKFKARFGIDFVYEFYGASDGNVGFFNLLNFNNTVGFSPNRYELVAFDPDDSTPLRDDEGHFIKVKNGEVGLLISEISTHFPLDGYTDKSETEKRILKNGFEPGDRWLNTGDLMMGLGFRHVQFIDRIGESYRWHGENISTQEVENVLLEHPNVREAVVYGVKIPNNEGRAGMATLELAQINAFTAHERHQFAHFLHTHLPSYAIPRFLRITKKIDTTDTFKYKKKNLQKEGYDLALIQDPIYILNLKHQTFDKLTESDLQAIHSGDLRF